MTLLVLSILLMLSVRPNSLATGCPCNSTSSRRALDAFYHAMSGPTWRNRSGWTGNRFSSVCDYYGVGCDNEGIELEMVNNNLTGTFADSVVLLLAAVPVSKFRLSHNAISGTLPPQLSDWGENITVFDLGANQLTGTLPASYSRWVNLLNFQVAENQLQGALPPAYRNWTALTVFEVYSNRINGTLPSEYSRWGQLTTFNAGSNDFTGTLPSAYSSWTGLRYFHVGNSSIRETLPPSYSQWSLLGAFNASFNELGGSLPLEFGAWGASLSDFDVSRNRLVGTIPVVYENLTLLRIVSFRSNQLRGRLPSSFSRWILLESFDVANNTYLTGTLPTEWSAWTLLTGFYVFGNNLSGTLPDAFSNWTSVKRIDVGFNGLSGTLPASLGSCTEMSRFSINNNRFSGTLPSEYGAWGSSFRYLEMHNNHVSGTLPASYQKWTKVAELLMSRNLLSGTLPTEYVAMKSLGILNLGGNMLTGTIPAAYFAPTGLVYLGAFIVSQNAVTGTIPPLHAAVFLGFFAVNSNNLTGSLPVSISIALRALLVDRNPQLNATLPDNYFMFTDLQKPFVSLCDTKTYSCIARSSLMQVEVLCPNDMTAMFEATDQQELWNAFVGLPRGQPVICAPQSTTAVFSDYLKFSNGITEAIDPVLVVAAAVGTVALSLARSAMLASAAPCTRTADLLLTSVDVVNAPLQLSIGTSAGAQHRGAVVGNILLWGMIVVGALICVAALRHFRSLAEPWLMSASRLRLPGACIVGVVLLLQQTVVSSTVLVSTSLTAADTMIGVFGLASVLALLGSLLCVLDPRSGRFSATARDVQHGNTHRVTPPYVGWRYYAHWLVGDRVVWAPCTRGRRGAAFVDAFGLLFRSCRRRRHWWLVVDCAATVLNAVVFTVPLGGLQLCSGQLWVCVALSALHLIAVVTLRPRHRHAALANVAWGSSVQLAVAVSAANGVQERVMESITLAGTVVSVLLSVLCIVGPRLLEKTANWSPASPKGRSPKRASHRRRSSTASSRSTRSLREDSAENGVVEDFERATALSRLTVLVTYICNAGSSELDTSVLFNKAENQSMFKTAEDALLYGLLS